MSKWINFNFHDIATMRVERSAPTVLLLNDMFKPFVTEREVENANLVVTGEITPLVDAAYGEVHGQAEFKYTESGVYIENNDVQVMLTNDGFTVQGTRELLVIVLPLLDRVMVQRGAGMIHSLTVDYRGQGVNMPAWGGVGKTSTMAKMVKKEGVAFMGDDWAFLNTEGQLLGFQKPMTIKPYHKAIYPHLFTSKARKPLVPNWLSGPLHSLTTRVHPIMAQYPRLARAARRWSPEHLVMQPAQAFPQAQFSTSAPLALNIFVERYDGSKPTLKDKNKKWMVDKMIGNFYSELTRHSKVVMVSLAAAGLISLDDVFHQKAEVLSQALGDTPSYLLSVPKSYSADHASDIIVEQIESLLSEQQVAVG